MLEVPTQSTTEQYDGNFGCVCCAFLFGPPVDHPSNTPLLIETTLIRFLEANIRTFSCVGLNGPVLYHTRWSALRSQRVARDGLASIDLWRCQCSWDGAALKEPSTVVVIDDQRYGTNRLSRNFTAADAPEFETFAISFVPCHDGFPRRLWA